MQFGIILLLMLKKDPVSLIFKIIYILDNHFINGILESKKVKKKKEKRKKYYKT